MATRKIRLDDEAERALVQIRKRTPYDVYRQLDPGPGGFLIAPSTDARNGVRKAISKKLHR